MRRIAIYKNNSFHYGSVKSVERFCRMSSLAQSCKMNHKSFQRCIDYILERPEKIVKSALAAITPKKKTVGADKKEVGISWHDIVRRDDIKQ